MCVLCTSLLDKELLWSALEDYSFFQIHRNHYYANSSLANNRKPLQSVINFSSKPYGLILNRVFENDQKEQRRSLRMSELPAPDFQETSQLSGMFSLFKEGTDQLVQKLKLAGKWQFEMSCFPRHPCWKPKVLLFKLWKANVLNNFLCKVNLSGFCRFNQDATGTLLISSSKHLQ